MMTWQSTKSVGLITLTPSTSGSKIVTSFDFRLGRRRHYFCLVAG